MMRKFKTLGLAMVAVLAMSAVVASAASAQFTANAYPTTGTATSALGNDVFTVDGSSVECAGHFEGTLKEASTTLTVTPTYSNCKAFGFASATVAMNGCDYLFHDVGSNTAGQVSVHCPAGKNIVITAGNCVVDVGTQTPPLKTVTYGNAHPNVTVKANVTGITANVTTDGFLCPLSGTGHKSSSYVQGSAVTVIPISGGNTISVD
jgi:hypothetical protein